MINAERILQVLDRNLDHQVELTLFGRAALALGFPNPPPVVERTLDVDVLLPTAQTSEIEADLQFWSALECANEELDAEGLYLTHIFQEDQIALASGWMERREIIDSIATSHLQLYRPSVADLILTKMMRGADEEDLADISFLMAQPSFREETLQEALRTVIMPPLVEIQELFEKARERVLDLIVDR